MRVPAIKMILVLFGGLLMSPSPASAQERVDRFSTAELPLRAAPESLTGSAAPLVTPRSDGLRAAAGTLGGGILGLGIGAGLGYLLYRDSTAGCDDGICGWVPPMIIGGAGGLVIGGWIGYRIAR